MTDTPRPTNPYPEIKGHRCPACGGSLFVGEGGYITCSWYRCPSPDYEIVLAGLGERLAAAEAKHAGEMARHAETQRALWAAQDALAAAEREGAEKERAKWQARYCDFCEEPWSGHTEMEKVSCLADIAAASPLPETGTP